MFTEQKMNKIATDYTIPTCPIYTLDEVSCPSKHPENAGYDLYSRWEMTIPPHATRLVPTGVKYALPSDDLWFLIKDRGSTGSIGLHTHCGVCDYGYRGEIFVALCNTTKYTIKITDKVDKVTYKRTWYGKKYIYYPRSKGIAQMIPIKSPKIRLKSVDEETWKKEYADKTNRGEGKLGSSGK